MEPSLMKMGLELYSKRGTTQGVGEGWNQKTWLGLVPLMAGVHDGETNGWVLVFKRGMQRRIEGELRCKEQEQEQEQEQESLLWMRGLPHDLLVRILAFLPVHKLLELQTVCKSWPSLYQSWPAEVAPRETWLVMRRNFFSRFPHGAGHELIAFCPSLNRWCHLPRSLWQHTFLASGGGLILREKCPRPGWQLSSAPPVMVVFNLLTKATKEISIPREPGVDQAPGRCRHIHGFEPILLANPVAGFYQIILESVKNPVTGLIPQGYVMQVYDSRTQSWEWKDPPSGDSNGQALVYDCQSQSWEWKARSYCGVSTRNVLDDDLFVLHKIKGEMLTYNAERRMRSTVKTPVPSCTSKAGGTLSLVLESIVKCSRRLLLVGALADGDTIECLGVWEWKPVDQGTGTWVELARTPPEYWEPHHGAVGSLCPRHQYQYRFRCSVANKNLICITVLDGFEEGAGAYLPPLAYDLDRGSWQRLPFYGDRADYLGLFAYEPSWSAVP